jgi:hypothetical protein
MKRINGSNHTNPPGFALWVIALAVTAIGTFGCERTTSPPPQGSAAPSVGEASPPRCAPATATLTPVWVDGDLHFKELVGATVRFRQDGVYYGVKLRSFPVGTSFTLGELTVQKDEDGRIDVGEAALAASPLAIKDSDFKINPHVDLEVRVPGFAPNRIPAPAIDARRDLVDTIAGAVNHPVLLGHEKASDPRPAQHTIVYVGHGRSDSEVFGPAATLREVDWVGVSEPLLPRPGGSCTFKSDTAGTPPTTAKVRLIDEEVTVVERRTSRVVARKTFAASPECPSYSRDSTVESSPDAEVITRWLREVRTGP